MIRLKSTLLALSLLTASPVFAQTNITGDWDVTVTSPQGTNTTPVTFKQEGAKVSGMFKSPQGTLPFENGSVTGDDLKFTFTINAQGMELPITLTGKIAGDTIAGKADFGGFAEGDWSAKRVGGDDEHVQRADDDQPRAPATSPPRVATRHRLRRQMGRDAEDAGRRHAGQRDVERRRWQAERARSAARSARCRWPAPPRARRSKLTLVAQTPQGDMTVVMTGDLDGDNIVNGKAEVSGMGQMEWSAKRVKQ